LKARWDEPACSPGAGAGGCRTITDHADPLAEEMIACTREEQTRRVEELAEKRIEEELKN
jgi:hypothetical protein